MMQRELWKRELAALDVEYDSLLQTNEELLDSCLRKKELLEGLLRKQDA